ncbi:uncharacterized protein DUF3141 [Pseudomonas duriflava]|uniref:Uncharacterized protein DUF3141 n=1 Tax=Pseudomonas duriflava TaxID=459528 RepID=A0A562PUE7_9PSED|nr:DUF3141 domain-containing protein [Pseudomonas duriflava]TWI48018.1 uncharacterized protein DUF3141 [Pseudomonas duriflava]
MNGQSFTALQKNNSIFLASLMQRFRHLQREQGKVIFEGLKTRQARKLAFVNEGRLRLPTPLDWQEYLVDFGQRSLLFWDTLRQHGDNNQEHERSGHPVHLKFEYETLLNGKDLPRPVNYSLLHILPPADQLIDPEQPPVIVIDPRGGHGSGIGGFKQDSIIGESLRAGHPTYFVAFSHSPAPGQTLQDISDAEARFIELVRKRHPDTSKPVVIGNCQAGWAIMGLAATRPELPGLVVINGAPLAYWAGVNGRNPMRYQGGLLGGAWMTRFGSDLGNGRFDGAWLVSNFEMLDPANTLWSKHYNLFSHIDTEAARFLDFERWWGSPTLLNAEEIEVIVDELFIGNRLAGDESQRHPDVDLRRVEAPIVVFCSDGDNITPPQQALNWIADIYPNDLALRAEGKTIVYLRHATIGHLGIFVSSKVARREHRHMIDAFDEIMALPPGLYEMIIDSEIPGTPQESYQFHFEPRQISDIHLPDPAESSDLQAFGLVNRISQLNNNLYDLFLRPVVKRTINEPLAEFLRKAHPFRLRQTVLSSANPALHWLPHAAAQAQQYRRPARPDNPLKAWQDLFATSIEDSLDTFRDMRDAWQESCFYGFYGWLGLLTGVRATSRPAEHEPELMKRLHQLLPKGGSVEAGLRIAFLLGRAAGTLEKESVDRFADHYRALVDQGDMPNIKTIREIARVQNLLVFAYPKESLRTLPHLLPDNQSRQQVLERTAQLKPNLISTEGTVRELWAELHSVLEQPLPASPSWSMPEPSPSEPTKELALSPLPTVMEETTPPAPQALPQAQPEQGEAVSALEATPPAAAQPKASEPKPPTDTDAAHSASAKAPPEVPKPKTEARPSSEVQPETPESRSFMDTKAAPSAEAQPEPSEPKSPVDTKTIPSAKVPSEPPKPKPSTAKAAPKPAAKSKTAANAPEKAALGASARKSTKPSGARSPKKPNQDA